MNLTITQTNELKTNLFLGVLRNRNFSLLWIGEAISVLGDHFYIVALPWLVPQLTGDALAMGAVLAFAAVPRALLMLVVSGMLIMLISLAMLFNPAVRAMEPAAQVGG